MDDPVELPEWATRWSAQVNDLVGGWIVTDYPHPLSEHDFRPEGDRSKFGYVFAECMTETDAKVIASLLNVSATPRPQP